MFRSKMIEVSLGMVLLGTIFSSVMYGVMLTQSYTYYHRFKKDPLIVKLLVLAVVILNTASMFFVGHCAWYYLVTTGSPRRLVWSFSSEVAISMIMSGLSESFLTYRVYKLSGKQYLLTGLLLSLVTLHFVSGEVAAIELLLLGTAATFETVKVPSILRLASAAACDTSIATSLCYLLHSKRTGFKRNDEVINYLMFFSINSGLITSIIAIASLITYVATPKTWVYTALCFLISRLYATTFLYSLNSRQILLNNNNVHDDRDEKYPIKVGAAIRPGRTHWPVNDGASPTQIDVYVVTETVSDGRSGQASGSAKSSKHLKGIGENASNSTLAETSASESSCHD